MLDLGVSMSSDCTFDFHISNLYKRCSNLAGWILRTFTMRDPQVMLRLYKSLVMSRLDYASQHWSPYLLKHVYLIEKVQRAFTKHFTGKRNLTYSKRLEVLKLIIGGGIARFTRVLFELPCYPQFELEIHIVEVSYFTNILIK